MAHQECAEQDYGVISSWNLKTELSGSRQHIERAGIKAAPELRALVGPSRRQMAALLMSCEDTSTLPFLLVVGGSPLRGLMEPRTRETFHSLLRAALSCGGRRPARGGRTRWTPMPLEPGAAEADANPAPLAPWRV